VARPIDAPSSCFLLAVTVSNLFGGLGPGLFSIALSALAFGRFFLWRDLPQSTEATVLRFTVFLAAVFLIAVLMEIKRRVEESRNRAEEELRGARADLAHVNRATAMGELTASLAHEVNQPIAAAVTDANTCLRWLSRDQPDLREAREAASRVVKDAIRASEIITRVRSLYKKGRAQRDLVDMNEVIREMVILLRSQAARNSVSIRTELSEDLPPIMGRSYPVAAGADEPHDQQHRSDEHYRGATRSHRDVAPGGRREDAGLGYRHRCRFASSATGSDL
jgi:signal transduction histidine kinase